MRFTSRFRDNMWCFKKQQVLNKKQTKKKKKFSRKIDKLWLRRIH